VVFPAGVQATCYMYMNRDNPIKYILFDRAQVGGGGIVRDPLVHKEVAVLLFFQPCSCSNAH
jgi:hypothetical protein